MTSSAPSAAWPDAIYDVLKRHDVHVVGYVPDAGHTDLIRRVHADNDMRPVVLTTEEEGIGLLAGAWMGNRHGVLLMQSSGVGNCVNFFSLIGHGRFPFLTIVSMRGDYGEGNPWQMFMGERVQAVMETCGIRCIRVEDAADLPQAVAAAAAMTWQSGGACALLLSQKLIGAKAFG